MYSISESRNEPARELISGFMSFSDGGVPFSGNRESPNRAPYTLPLYLSRVSDGVLKASFYRCLHRESRLTSTAPKEISPVRSLQGRAPPDALPGFACKFVAVCGGGMTSHIHATGQPLWTFAPAARGQTQQPDSSCPNVRHS